MVQPIESYEAGMAQQCRATFYIGSYFENDVPDAFIQDYLTSSATMVWMGYTLWKVGNAALEDLFGVHYARLTSLDLEHTDSKGRPAFFQRVDYKGERFAKYGEFDASGRFHAPFEMVALKVVSDKALIPAEAIHTFTGERLPYALRRGQKFYVADVPFSYMHEADRYLIFADLLFDILSESPRHAGKRPAIFRVEDVHPRSELYQVWNLARTLHSLQIPFHLAMIAAFTDPNHAFFTDDNDLTLPLNQHRQFVELVKLIEKRGGEIIWHGVTHQYDRWANPHSGMSGDDFEFWDAIHNRPLPEDSVTYVLDRLDDGIRMFRKAGFNPQIWEVPHYQASALDYIVFRYVFPWTIGRIMYIPFGWTSDPPKASPLIEYPNAVIDPSGRDLLHEQRREHLANLQIHTLGTQMNGQFFPYEIYGDVYGQRVLPENLGNPQPFVSSHVSAPRSIQEMLSCARRNIKLRDAWGSLFFHPQLLNPTDREGLAHHPGDTRQLRQWIQSMKDMGYTFVSLKDWISKHGEILRPEPMYPGGTR
jgi:uncharacterized protein YdaL